MNCALCDIDVTERPSVLVDFEGGIAEVCDSCIEKADPEVEERLDFLREGLPEFTGVFG